MYSQEGQQRRYNYPSVKMKKKDSDTYSATSGTSKNSGEKGRKGPRISLQRMFFRHSTRSARNMLRRSQCEVESRSISNLQASSSAQGAVGGVMPGPLETSVTVDTDSTSSTSSRPGSGKTIDGFRECPLCLAQLTVDNFPVIHTCHHRSCRDCLKQYLKIEITESRINIACPECAERFHPNDIKSILEDDILMDKYEVFMLRRVLVLDPDARWCPAPDCGYAVIATGCASCPKLRCERPGCDTYFCYHCKQHWHPNQTCDAARAERTSQMRSSSITYSHESTPHNDIKPCPRCGAFIIKMDDGSCNHMTCAVCGAEFCWLCMKEISDLHYLSPSGCTFWGRKPWSRKKKILWQLGTLVGAPVGIALVAGIAVPAMIIGIPVWVGRKMRAKYDHLPKHKRNLAITGGVAGSILVSPILAGLAVGIGVPILLAYVYGVVPVSLCRSGGCGVTTTNSGGVRFEFDDENDVTVGVSGPYSAEEPAVTAEARARVANPSIGPSIGEMSMGQMSMGQISMGLGGPLSASGTHLERVGLHGASRMPDADSDSASNRAIAPASLEGSVCGSMLAGHPGYHNRLEVQVDVSSVDRAASATTAALSAGAAASSSNKRASISSESANVSLDAKSATVSFGDDTASTKALAGSLCTRDKDNNSAIVTIDIGTDTRDVEHSRPIAGSPTSNRSVTFYNDNAGAAGTRDTSFGRRRFHGRQSVSIGDSIHEHATENTSSTVSLTAAAAAGGGGCGGSSDGEGGGSAAGSGGLTPVESETTVFRTGKSGSSSSGCTTSSSGPMVGRNDPAGHHAGTSECQPFPPLEDTLGLPHMGDTHRSASELDSMPSLRSDAAVWLDKKKRSLSMNDSSVAASVVTTKTASSSGRNTSPVGGLTLLRGAGPGVSHL